MKNLICSMLLFAGTLSANILTDEFVTYHLRVAMDEIEDEDVFKLIQENVKNLDLVSTSDAAATELIFLIEEGYKIDSYNISKLIEALDLITASKNATKVLIAAVENHSMLNATHLTDLIHALSRVSTAANATKVILKAIECGVPFSPKERLLLAEKSKEVSAKKYVDEIRKALHKREMV